MCRYRAYRHTSKLSSGSERADSRQLSCNHFLPVLPESLSLSLSLLGVPSKQPPRRNLERCFFFSSSFFVAVIFVQRKFSKRVRIRDFFFFSNEKKESWRYFRNVFEKRVLISSSSFFSTSLEKVDAIKGLRLSLPTCNIYSTGRRLIDEETLSLSFVSLFSLFDVLGLATTHTRTDKVEDDRRSK